ncbi:hypothetical protein PDJAM_G00041320 [Pangasius djambal]|uniref:Uncharacterized protein n=1 Tax=Pangasius djambal TaxID=1691987 RepID=A0ACC5YSW3_9TELE|nr:hypothetical protein [Pangasius djambal]
MKSSEASPLSSSLRSDTNSGSEQEKMLSVRLLLLSFCSVSLLSPGAGFGKHRLCGVQLVEALLLVCGDKGLFYQPGRRGRDEDIRKMLSVRLLLLSFCSVSLLSPGAGFGKHRLCGVQLVEALLLVCGDKGLFYQPGRRGRDEDIQVTEISFKSFKDLAAVWKRLLIKLCPGKSRDRRCSDGVEEEEEDFTADQRTIGLRPGCCLSNTTSLMSQLCSQHRLTDHLFDVTPTSAVRVNEPLLLKEGQATHLTESSFLHPSG